MKPGVNLTTLRLAYSIPYHDSNKLKNVIAWNDDESPYAFIGAFAGQILN